MTQVIVPGSKAGAATLKVVRRFWKTLEEELVAETARFVYQSVVEEQVVDTGLLATSTTISAGEARGLGLPYGPSYTPRPVDNVLEQALSARKFGEALIVSEDAESPSGFAYGLRVIEPRARTFANAAAAVRRAGPTIAAKALAKASARAFS